MKVAMMIVYLIIGILCFLGFLGEKNQRMREACLMAVVAMGLLAFFTAMFL